MGDIDFHNITAVVRQPRVGPNAPKVDGVLGFGLFTDYLLTLDYPAKQLRLARGELPAANGKDIVPFDNPRVIPIIEISVGQSQVKAHIDSGNLVAGFILPTTLVDQLQLATEPVIVGRARTVSNEVEIRQAQLSDKIKIGGFEFDQPTITFPAIADEVNIGLKVLRDFALTFDQKNKRVRFEHKNAS